LHFDYPIERRDAITSRASITLSDGSMRHCEIASVLERYARTSTSVDGRTGNGAGQPPPPREPDQPWFLRIVERAARHQEDRGARR
jgi:hypothetical protein